MSRLSIEEKARIDFEDCIRFKAKQWASLSDEQKRVIEEDEKQRQYEPMTLEGFEQGFRHAHSFFDELRERNYFQKLNGVDVYDLFIDDMKYPTHNFHPNGFENSKITNMSSNPELLSFLIAQVDRFYFVDVKFRCVSNQRLDYVVQNGTDRADRKTFVSPYPNKALEYGVMPKLLLVYDGDGINYLGGIEGYEHEFTKEPKSLLQCVMRVHLQE